MATIQDVARLAGVSTATVSRVLNDNYKVSDHRRQKVMDAVAQLNYRPNIIGRNLSRNENRTILVVSGAIDDGMLRGAYMAAKELGYDIILSYSPVTDDSDALKYFDNGLASGILFINFMHSDSKVIELCRKYPVVQCAEYLDFPEANLVSIHDDVAAYQLTEHLVKQGRKNFAFLAPRSTAERSVHFSLERERGFRRALQDHGIALNPSLLRHYSIQRSGEGVEQIVNEMLNQRDAHPFDALVCAQDMSGLICVNLLREAGLRVPQDVAVTGFDDRLAGMASPKLTTVRQPFYEMGAESLRLLVALMHDATDVQKRVFLDHQLILRGSTEEDLR